jgi:hypothetical protein
MIGQKKAFRLLPARGPRAPKGRNFLYDDLKSLYHGGDKGWGVLAERGVTIIQTDWPFELREYLVSRGLKT